MYLPLDMAVRHQASLLLSEQVCFALYSTMAAMNKVYRGLLAEIGVTYPQYLVLLVLWEEDGRTVSEIGDRLFLDSATLTPLLKRMEASKLVTRTRDPEDERQVIVSLTERGRAARRKAQAVANGAYCAAGCSPEELRSIRDRLLDLRSKLLASA